MTFKTIDLNLVLKKAKAETITMIESEIDISDSSTITPLEALANEYPEMASTCNSILLELINDQPTHISDRAGMGANVTILKGVTIGEKAVIGAGSVVTKDIPSGAIAVGVPAKLVRYQDTIG